MPEAATRHIFVPLNAKIADITHADTTNHTLTLANAAGTGAISGETRKILWALLSTIRVSGSSNLKVFPNDGTTSVKHSIENGAAQPMAIADGTQHITYACGAANDDYDLYCFGYEVEP